MKPKKSNKAKIGDIPEKYDFFLNPYPNRVFYKCPKCDSKTKKKKLPLSIEIEIKKMFFNLNKTCRFCENCELLIVKKAEIEDILYVAFGIRITDKDYIIVGTFDEDYYVEGVTDLNESGFFSHLFLFKNVWNFEPMPRYVWVKDKK
ncbi:MAG: hypothetical protein KKF44_06200 [Nanoarchaeota archaeon]|nr:hypothetical protein [Nanoarchaeota archaeon]